MIRFKAAEGRDVGAQGDQMGAGGCRSRAQMKRHFKCSPTKVRVNPRGGQTGRAYFGSLHGDTVVSTHLLALLLTTVMAKQNTCFIHTSAARGTNRK